MADKKQQEKQNNVLRKLLTALTGLLLLLSPLPLVAQTPSIELPIGPIIPKVEKKLYDQLKSENQELTRKNTELVRKNKAVLNQAEELRKKLEEQMEQARQEAVDTTSTSKVALAECRSENEKWQVTGQRATDKIEGSIAALAECRSENEKWQTTGQQATDKIEGSITALAKCRSENKECRNENQKWQEMEQGIIDKIDAATTALTECRHENETMRKAGQGTTQRAADCKAKIADCQDVNNKLQGQLEAVLATNTRTNKQLIDQDKNKNKVLRNAVRKCREKIEQSTLEAKEQANAASVELAECRNKQENLLLKVQGVITKTDKAGSTLKQCQDETLAVRKELKKCRAKSISTPHASTPPSSTPNLSETWTDKKIGLEFALVQGGCVQTDETSTETCLDSFYLSPEITIAQYLAFLEDKELGNNPAGVDWQSSHCPLEKKGNDYSLRANLKPSQPMIALKQEGVNLYAQWMNKRFTDKHFRLSSGTEQALADKVTTESFGYAVIDTNINLGQYNMSDNIWQWERKEQENAPEDDSYLTQGFRLFLSLDKNK